jgi:hypothetical protein
VRRIASILLLLATGALLRAASTDYFLGESVRQLGLRDVARQAGDGKSSERYATRAGVGFYAEYSRDHIFVDGIKVMLDDPIGFQKGHLTISRRDYDKVFVPLFWENPRGPVGRVLLDPGHGGKDTGKVNAARQYNEKAATLDTAARLKLLLEKQGIEVLFTRTKDVFVELEDRSAMAARLRADLFISLHYNAGPAGDTTADGIETYCLTPAGQRSTNAGKARSTTAAEPGNRFDAANVLLAWSVQGHRGRRPGRAPGPVRGPEGSHLPGRPHRGRFHVQPPRRRPHRRSCLPSETRRGHGRRRGGLRRPGARPRASGQISGTEAAHRGPARPIFRLPKAGPEGSFDLPFGPPASACGFSGGKPKNQPNPGNVLRDDQDKQSEQHEPNGKTARRVQFRRAQSTLRDHRHGHRDPRRQVRRRGHQRQVRGIHPPGRIPRHGRSPGRHAARGLPREA